MIAFALLAGSLSALKTHAVQKGKPYAKYLPSGVAFAIGFLNTPSFSLARLVGGIVEYLYRTRYARNKDDIRLVSLVSKHEDDKLKGRSIRR
jgi:uncharacterized oligopeptide transporter (OPT) family protein